MDEAIKSFQQAIRLKPGLYVPNLFTGIDSLQTANTSQAIQFLVKAERMNKTDPVAPLELGRAYSAAGNFLAAAKAFTRATELDPKQSDAWLGEGMAYLDQVEEDARKLSTGGPHSSYAQALYAESMARQSRYIEAADGFRKAMAAQPQPPCLHAEFGFMYVKQKKIQDAESEFKQESRIVRYCRVSGAGGSSGRNRRSYVSIMDCEVQKPADDGMRSAAQASSIHAKRKRRAAAFRLRLSAPVTMRSRRVRRGRRHTMGGLYWSIKANQALALQSLTHFQQIAPNSVPSHVLLGDMYRQRQRYDDALAQYKLALEMSPTDHAALLGLAYAYFGDANIDATIATATTALAANPGDPELNVLMGEALVARHDFAGAEPYLQKGLAAKPQMLPQVHALLGTVYAETGRTEDAIAQLEMGQPADGDGSIHYRLARMYRKAGETKKAEAAMQQVKLLEQQRQKGAVTALEDSSQPVDDLPKATP